MITVRIMGGMGNQMFQYAAARALALRTGQDLQLDISSFKRDVRMYSLCLWRGVTARTVIFKADPVTTTVEERGLHYQPHLLQSLPQNSYLVGYWQTEKYFSEIRSLLQHEFQPKAPITARGQETSRKIQAEGDKSVFLTVRRTDFLTNKTHGLLPLSYYEQACATIATKVPDPHFFVFSDDPEWCRQHFRLPYRITVAGNFDRTVRHHRWFKGHLGREDEELWLMWQCRHAVMANSSYSWWGAWLGADLQGGIIIGPRQYLASSNLDTSDIIPSRWLKI